MSHYFPWLLLLPALLPLLWLAWRRPNRQRLYWRLLASAVSGVSLLLFVFPPTVQKPVTPTAAVLLTDGYNPDTLRTLLNKQQAKPSVYSYKVAAEDALALPSLYDLYQRQPSIQKVHVLGCGLDEAELKVLQHTQLMFYPAPVPHGVQAISWLQSVTLGDEVKVTGTYAAKGGTKLYLKAVAPADSATVKPDSTQQFDLRYTPKQEGRFTYTLLAAEGTRTDTLGQLPVQVLPTKKLRVLLLASSPSFEFKFLKNHLAKLQHSVALRTTVSKDLSQSEWLNMRRADLSLLTPKLLQQFDLVVTDPAALARTSATERKALQQAVTDSGLGILTIADAPVTNRSTAFFTDFRMRQVSTQLKRTTTVFWGENKFTPATAAPYTLANEGNIHGLVKAADGALLAGAKRVGWGKVAVSVVPQTYTWALAGQEQTYADYWASVLEEVAKEQVQEKFWQLSQPLFPKPDKPVVLTFTDYTRSPGAAVPKATVVSLSDSIKTNVPLAQHLYQPEQLSTTYWPRRSGWHQVSMLDSEPFYFFVQDLNSWQFADKAKRLAATLTFVARQSAENVSSVTTYKQEPVPLIVFFVLFVLSSGFLWLEEKF